MGLLGHLVNAIRGPAVNDRDLADSADDVARFNNSATGVASDAPWAPFVLLLRTFGADGKVRAGASKDGPGFKTDHLEAIVASVAAQFGTRVVGLDDERAQLRPAGVEYYEADHADWFAHFLALADRAKCIVVFSTGEIALGEAFKKELQSLKGRELNTKTVVVCPSNLGEQRHQRKDQLFEVLGWPTLRAMPLVSFRPLTGAPGFVPSLGINDDALSERYRNGLEIAFSRIMR